MTKLLCGVLEGTCEFEIIMITRRAVCALQVRAAMWAGVGYTPMYVDEDTPRMQVPYRLSPWENIGETKTIGYLRCSTKRMRDVFGPGQPVRGQWVLTFTPPGQPAYVVNIYRSLQRDAHREWNVSAKYWPEEWEDTSHNVVEGVTARCQAVVNMKLAAVAGAVFGRESSDSFDFRRLLSSCTEV